MSSIARSYVPIVPHAAPPARFCQINESASTEVAHVKWSPSGTYTLVSMWVEYHELICGAIVRDVIAMGMLC